MWKIGLTTLIIAQTLGATQLGKPLQVLGVCDLLATDPTKFNGKVISVRGQLGSTDHGLYLIGECKTHLFTKGLKWGDHISVYPELGGDPNIARAWDRLARQLKRLHADLRRDKVLVTIVGKLDTRDSLDDMVVSGPDGPTRLGFGHMNGSPAEINVLSIEIIEVKREHTPPK